MIRALLLALAFAMPAHAAPPEASSDTTFIEKSITSEAVFDACAVADVATTSFIIGHGGQELNLLIVRLKCVAALPWSLALCMAPIVAARHYFDDDIPEGGKVLANVGKCLPAAHNLLQIIH